MNNGVIVWLIIFALAASSFLVIAVIVSIKGFADLQDLLQHSKHRDKPNAKLQEDSEKVSE